MSTFKYNTLLLRAENITVVFQLLYVPMSMLLSMTVTVKRK